MTVKEIIDGLKFTVEMFLLDPDTNETLTEPRNDLDKITVDACRGAIELLEQTDSKQEIGTTNKVLAEVFNKIVKMSNDELIELLKLIDKQQTDSVLEDIKTEFIKRYPINYCGEPELGGVSCVFSLNDVLKIIDKHINGKKKRVDEFNKEIAKQVILSGDGYSNGELVYDFGECPNCGWNFEEGDKDWEEPFCCHCGQKLHWFDEE